MANNKSPIHPIEYLPRKLERDRQNKTLSLKLFSFIYFTPSPLQFEQRNGFSESFDHFPVHPSRPSFYSISSWGLRDDLLYVGTQCCYFFLLFPSIFRTATTPFLTSRRSFIFEWRIALLAAPLSREIVVCILRRYSAPASLFQYFGWESFSLGMLHLHLILACRNQSMTGRETTSFLVEGRILWEFL